MAGLAIGNHSSHHRVVIILTIIFIGVLAAGLVATFLVAQKTRERLQESQALTYQKPAAATKRQIKKLILERLTPAGIEYVEISENGQVCVYDANHQKIKCGFQGYARTTSLFNDIVGLLDKWRSGFSLPGGYVRLIAETNMGTVVVDLQHGSGGGGGGPIDDILDEINDYTDDTFAPTPTFIPTPTTIPGQPWPTPTPTPAFPTHGPSVAITPGVPTPTLLPEYMRLPPFKCEDYKLTHPFTISNVVCNTDK